MGEDLCKVNSVEPGRVAYDWTMPKYVLAMCYTHLHTVYIPLSYIYIHRKKMCMSMCLVHIIHINSSYVMIVLQHYRRTYMENTRPMCTWTNCQHHGELLASQEVWRHDTKIGDLWISRIPMVFIMFNVSQCSQCFYIVETGKFKTTIPCSSLQTTFSIHTSTYLCLVFPMQIHVPSGKLTWLLENHNF